MNTTYGRRSRGGPSSGHKRGPSKPSSFKRGGFKGGGSKPRHSGNRSRGGGGSRGGGRKMPTFDPSRFINKNPVSHEVAEVYTPKHTFNTIGLDPRLAKVVTDMGITVPSPIQDQAIPEILAGRDIVGLAETGTGKTAAFLLPLIERAFKDRFSQTLILAPTRELAIQIKDELALLSKDLRIFSAIGVGGTHIGPQIKSLRNKNQFIIGTPGRILDLINKKYFKTQNVHTVVLDEADRMLDMGFIGDIRKILGSIPKIDQTLLFSATMTEEAKNLVHDFLKDPINISVKKKDVTNSIVQDVVRYKHAEKFDTLVKLLKSDEFTRVIVFGAMKHSVEKLARQLSKEGVRAESIHGNKSHPQRQRALSQFKSGRSHVLVATDVAARGIHVEDVSHVINYDLPGTFEDYVHRIGRTGRAAKKGKALTFVSL